MRGKPARQQVVQSTSVPSPVGGWNAKDSIASMPPTDAVVLENWFPAADRVTSRGGYEAYATLTLAGGGDKDVDTLAVWTGPGAYLEDSTNIFWAIAVNGSTGSAPIHGFDVSTSGTKTANASFTALGHVGFWARYSQCMFNNAAGYYLYLCDEMGVNPPCHFNGTTWAAPTITGVTPADLVHVNLYKYRLYFCERDSLNIWFLPLDAIQGAVSKLSLSGYCNEGGYVVATAGWTVDGGDGSDDKFVAITSEGQVAIYSGTDPTSASSWALEGVYKTAPPIGKRCLFKYGADLFIITTDGLVALSSVFNNSATNQVPALSDKIRLAFQADAKTFGPAFGWQALYYPRGPYIFVNVPQYPRSDLEPVRYLNQFVMNSQTQAWCKFTGQKGSSWALFNEDLYFGQRGGLVRKADTGNNDDTGVITLSAQQAFSYFGMPGQNKKFNLARPTISTDAETLSLGIGLATDFKMPTITAQAASAVTPPAVTFYTNWATYGGIGFCAALIFNQTVDNCELNWFATDFVMEPGGIL